MPRVFVGNFDFEHELADERYIAPAHVREIAAELASSWVAVANAEDLIWSPGRLPAFDFHEFSELAGFQPRFVQHERELPRGLDWEFVPWGWTASVLRWGKQFGWSCAAPSVDVVKQVNSRAYRWELESHLDIDLPDSAILATLEQTVTHIERFGTNDPTAGWVLKANFGMSGRERQLGRGPELTIPVLNWAKRRLQQSSALVFEPWLERIAEAGIQIEIPQAGEPILLGVLPLLTDPTGTYRGSRVQCSDAETAAWDSAVQNALKVAREVQGTGYFGPLGIDAMQYRDRAGISRIRSLQDLNARFTMGRLAVGLRRYLGHDRNVDWVHDSRLLIPSLQTNSHPKFIQITSRSWLVDQCP